MNVEFTKGVLSEYQLQLIEDAARAIGLETERYTVRDTTMIHRKVPTRFGPMKAVWNPLDPNTGHHFDILKRAQRVDIQMRDLGGFTTIIVEIMLHGRSGYVQRPGIAFPDITEALCLSITQAASFTRLPTEVSQSENV